MRTTNSSTGKTGKGKPKAKAPAIRAAGGKPKKKAKVTQPKKSANRVDGAQPKAKHWAEEKSESLTTRGMDYARPLVKDSKGKAPKLTKAEGKYLARNAGKNLFRAACYAVVGRVATNGTAKDKTRRANAKCISAMKSFYLADDDKGRAKAWDRIVANG